uniref:RGS domain-containing protein n=1 Tax=Esox lucius TaxID=8010 RepID=A0AAY5KZ50_ESOLU
MNKQVDFALRKIRQLTMNIPCNSIESSQSSSSTVSASSGHSEDPFVTVTPETAHAVFIHKSLKTESHVSLKSLFLSPPNADGVETFSQFLRTEFSEENIEFWLACEEYKSIHSETKKISKAKQMYAVFIESEAPKEVNIDYATKQAIQKNIAAPTDSCFDAAQTVVYGLMKKDCYPRFLTSDIYLRLTKRKGPGTTMYRRRSRSCVFNEPRGEATSDSAWL